MKYTRKKTVTIDEIKFAVGALTVAQVEELFPGPGVEKKYKGALGAQQTVCYGLNNAAPDSELEAEGEWKVSPDPSPDTSDDATTAEPTKLGPVRYLKHLLDNVILEKLQETIFELSGLRVIEAGNDESGESSAAAPESL